MFCARRPNRLMLCVAIAACAAASGCNRSSKGDAGADLVDLEGYRPGSPAVVMPFAEMGNYAHMGNLPHESQRFEFSRNDFLLGVIRRRPILASNQWPSPTRPVERPVRFHRWRQ